MKTLHQLLRRFVPVFCCLYFALPAQAQWDSLQLPCRPNIQTLQAWQGKIYATATAGAVFESADQGATWKFAFDAPNFQINPNTGSFCGYQVEFGGVWFHFAQTHWNNGSFSSLAPFIDPSAYRAGLTFSNDSVYIFKGNELLRFVPQQGWAILTPPANFYINNLLVSGQHFWITDQSLALHSPDGGATWDTVATDPQYRLSLAAAGDTILLNYFDDLLQTRVLARTNFQGQNWTSTTNHPGIATVKSGQPFLGYDASNQTAWYSQNGLSDWQLLNTEFLPNALLLAGARKIAAQGFGIQVETNGQWTSPLLGTGIWGEMAYAQVFLRKANGILLFGGDRDGHGRFQRPSGASAWTAAPTPYFSDRSVQIGNQLIGCGRYGTYRAQLGGPGFEWTLLNAQTGYLFESNGMLYLGDPANGNIYRSNNTGQNWTLLGTAPGTDFQNSFAAEGGRFFMRIGADLMVSENEGLSWSKRYTFSLVFDIPGSAKLVGLNGNLYLTHVVTQQIFRSQDAGLSFSALNAPKHSTAASFRLRNFGGQLFLVNGDGKLYRSSDQGQNWKTVKPPYPGFNFDPGMALSTMLVDNGQLYLYDTERGAAWQADLADLEPSPCDAVYIDLPPTSCELYGDLNINMPNGMLCTWLEDGVQVQQSGNWFVQFPTKNGSSYTVIITDPVSGCSVSDETVVNVPIAQINYQPLMSCDEQLQTLDLSGSTKGPGVQYSIWGYTSDHFYYNYYNKFDTQGQPSNPDPPVVRPGTYILQVLNPQLNCYAFDTAFIHHAVENPILDLQITQASCGQNDGGASLQFSSNPALTTIDWSTGASGTVVSSLAPGWYSVTVSEGFCAEHRNFEIVEDPACKVKIRGTVQYDPENADCVADWVPFEPGGIMLHLLPDDIFTFTDKFGAYEFIRPPGNYTVEFTDHLHYEVHCPGAGGHSLNLPNFGSISEGNDFFIKKKTAPNLGITVTPGVAIRGTTLHTNLEVCNFSSETAAGVTLALKYDPLLTNLGPQGLFQTHDPVAHTAVSINLTLNSYPTCQDYYFSMDLPANAPLGAVLHFSMDILPVDNDIFPVDNHVEWAQTVVGSYDPNDKQVSPGDTEWGGLIFESDSLLRYTIRFQNTGNYPAYTVEIRDTLDPNFDVSSIRVSNSSHFNQLQPGFEGKNVLVLRFDNINLPDSSFDAANSQGFVTFSIRRKPGLPIGTVLRNRAAIYFDFNEPVITNTVESVLSGPLGTPAVPALPPLRVCPNPSTGTFTALLPQPAPVGTLLRLYDLAGRLALEQGAIAGSQQQRVPADGLLPGLYFLQVLVEGRVFGVARVLRE